MVKDVIQLYAPKVTIEIQSKNIRKEREKGRLENNEERERLKVGGNGKEKKEKEEQE